jgi:hemerythrin-like domain-containing protein
MRDLGDPFDQLRSSHRRLEERLDELGEAARKLAAGGPEANEAREIVDGLCGWFARSVGRHEEDEERSLFPRLKDEAALAPILASLTAEHREHERLHAKLRSAEPAALPAIADALYAAYRKHIDEEERALFPAAERLLDDEARRAMIEEMESRRGRGGGQGGGGGGSNRGGGRGRME